MQSENDLRQKLGVPPVGDPRAQRVMLLCPTPHLDWDWMKSFSDYYQNQVQNIFTKAGGFMATPTAQAYAYAVAEVGYLAQHALSAPAAWDQMKQTGLLRVVGGGITSPDNLLPHGETLLRNYLTGSIWVRQNLPGLSLTNAWIPDDFGHDANFPSLLEAMGFVAVGFERVPGWSLDNSTGTPNPFPRGTTAWLLSSGDSPGLDFFWQAPDGARVIAHWLMGGYGAGKNITGTGASAAIQHCYDVSQSVSRTPYLYVPVGDDFFVPIGDLPACAVGWNQKPTTSGVFAAVASFDDYVAFLQFHLEALPTRGQNPLLPFSGTPYWTGFYGTRPAIKILHHQATQALLGAELFGVIASIWLDKDDSTPAGGWEQLVPSTHHDFITGTANSEVVTGEQLPRLTRALKGGQQSLQAAQWALANALDLGPPAGTVPVVVFNPLGFDRGGLVKLASFGTMTPSSVQNAQGDILGPVQVLSDGTWLFTVPDGGVPSTGFAAYYLGTDAAPPPGLLSLNVYRDPGGQWVVQLRNAWMTATLNESDSFGISALSEDDGPSPYPVLNGVANNPLFYSDAGDLYRFGNEGGRTFEEQPASFALTRLEQLETGPLRIRVRITGTFTWKAGGAPFSQEVIREYALAWNEPFLRMSTHTAAPEYYSVLVRFPFGEADLLLHGTAYHWDVKPAQPMAGPDWPPPVFQPTHDFVIPISGGPFLGALYHAHLPAWGMSPDSNSLLGCLVRNCPTTWVGGDADDQAHTLEYALRVPGGLSHPTTGVPLRESLAFHTPLVAQGNLNTSGRLPTAFSFAWTSDSRVMVTALKQGTVPGVSDDAIILRLYQPTNTALQVTLNLAPPPPGKAWQVSAVSALEIPLEAGCPLELETGASGTQVTVTLARSLTTLALRAL